MPNYNDQYANANAVNQVPAPNNSWSITRIFQYLPQIMAIVASIEAMSKSAKGDEKKRAAVAAIGAILQTSEGFIIHANPAYGAIVADLVDFVVKQMNAWLDLSGKQTVPTPTPTPVPIGGTGPGDYTTARYASLDDAKAARNALPTPDGAVVYQTGLAQYQLWPKGINFFGTGTQVYP